MTNSKEKNVKSNLYSAILDAKGDIDADLIRQINSCNLDGLVCYAIDWIEDELRSIATSRNLKIFISTLKNGDRYCGFNFKKPEWNKCIQFQFTMPYWNHCYYGVYSPAEIAKEKRRKMEGMMDKPNDHYCYGNAYTSCPDWTKEAFISGKVLPSITKALDSILKELDANKDKYSME